MSNFYRASKGLRSAQDSISPIRNLITRKTDNGGLIGRGTVPFNAFSIDCQNWKFVYLINPHMYYLEYILLLSPRLHTRG